jgi:ABC-type sugar transport system permease subunit
MTAILTRRTPARWNVIPRRRDRRAPLFFLAPWLIGVIGFFGYPLVMTVWLSFTNSNMISQPSSWGSATTATCWTATR